MSKPPESGAAFGPNLTMAGSEPDGLPPGATMAPPDLLAELPDAVARSYSQFPDQIIAMSGFLRDPDHHQAVQTVLTHVVNDVVTLWDDALRGRGRPAAHAARALYEHLINFCDVVNSTTAADRYMEHRHVTDALIADHGIGLDLLTGTDRRKERERLKRLGATAMRLRDAVMRRPGYGAQFVRSWTPQDLRTRAARHGLEGPYDTYKILSSVIHGSSGGLIGTTKLVQGVRVHRIGNDYQLAALALLEGTRSFREVLDRIVNSPDGGAWAAQHLRDTADTVIGEWPAFRAAALHVDRNAWPQTAPPPRTAAVLALYPNARRRWFMIDIANDVIVQAQTPVPEPAVPQAILDSLATYDSSTNDGKPLTVMFEGIRLTPKPGASAAPSEAILTVRRAQGQ